MIDISKIKIGMTRQEIMKMFGVPPIKGASSKNKVPTVYRYGNIEFGFGPNINDGLFYAMNIGESGQEHDMILERTV